MLPEELILLFEFPYSAVAYMVSLVAVTQFDAANVLLLFVVVLLVVVFVAEDKEMYRG